MTLAEKLTLWVLGGQLLVLAGQLVVFRQQKKLMTRQLQVSAEAEERAQRHDRLMVRPYLDYQMYFVPGQMRIVLTNEGSGVAIIKQFDVLIDDDKLPDEVVSIDVTRAFINALSFSPEAFDPRFKPTANMVVSDTALRPGGEIEILNFRLVGGMYSAEHMKRIRILVEYESLYREPFKLVMTSRTK